jgi:FKBP-type peptidyl-prolyl cis-trans isomerase
MIVVLCVGLVVSNILRQGIEIRVVQEGMSNEDGKESMKEGIAELDESDDTIIKDKSKEDGAKEDESKEDESKEDESKEDGAKEDKSKEDGAKEEPKPADEDVLLNSKLEYKRLLELQNKLIDGVSKMTPILKEAREAFENIKNMNGV